VGGAASGDAGTAPYQGVKLDFSFLISPQAFLMLLYSLGKGQGLRAEPGGNKRRRRLGLGAKSCRLGPQTSF